MRTLVFLLGILVSPLVSLAAAGGESVERAAGGAEAPPGSEPRMPVKGDCAMFREGGEGYILKTPTYWLRGTVDAIYRRPHRMALCPQMGKPRERYTRDDWMRVADAYPCVTDPAKEREVEAIRIRLRADAWDTPWTSQHGHNGWLYRGHFLNTELKEGVILDIDGTLLERCEPRE